MDFISLALAALATARITRLITTDTVTASVRAAVVQRLGAESKLAYLVHCDWCVSIYVGTATATAWQATGGSAWFQIPALALAASHLTGFMASRTED